MELQRKIRTIINNVRSTSGKLTTTVRPHQQHSSQGVAALVVMIAVLTIIILFCCCAAPGIRSLCKRYVFRTCVIDDPNIDNVYTRKYGYDTRDEINEIREYKNKLAEHSQTQRSCQ